MIERVEFKNFRCLKDVSLRLGPLTALVGPNATGKSTVLRGLEPGFVNLSSKETWLRSAKVYPGRTLTMGDGAVYRHRRAVGEAEIKETAPFEGWALRLDVNALRSENLVQQQATLASTGANLTNVFATLPRRVQTQVASEFCKLVPVFADVDARPSKDGHHRLCFQDRWREDLWYDPGEVSDGTMLMFAYSLLAHQTEPPDLLTIEEPEHGLHPYLMQQLIALLRGIAEGTIGRRPIQVVLATHSAELLEHLRPEEVRFLSREADGSVTIEEAPVDDPDWKRVYDEYQQSMSALWLSGNLGGVPRSAA
jgi:predicted ATPase